MSYDDRMPDDYEDLLAAQREHEAAIESDIAFLDEQENLIFEYEHVCDQLNRLQARKAVLEAQL